MPARRFKPTHFPTGISTDAPTSNLANLGYPDPTNYVTYFDDFLKYQSTEWTVTNTTGTVTIANGSLARGCITATNDATASSSNTAIYAATSVGGGFTVQPYVAGSTKGERLFFATHFKVTDLATVFGIGLYKYNTTAGLAPADGLFFLSTVTTGVVKLTAISSAGGTTTSATIATMAANTFIELAYVYEPEKIYKDGSSTGPLNIFVNGALSLSVPSTNVPASTVVLTPGYAVLGASKVLTIDYVMAAQERRN
jgi:hypothetical protein